MACTFFVRSISSRAWTLSTLYGHILWFFFCCLNHRIWCSIVALIFPLTNGCIIQLSRDRSNDNDDSYNWAKFNLLEKIAVCIKEIINNGITKSMSLVGNIRARTTTRRTSSYKHTRSFHCAEQNKCIYITNAFYQSPIMVEKIYYPLAQCLLVHE